jgi:uncharacterized protein YwgA
MAAPADAGFEKKRDVVLFVLQQVGKIEGRTRFQKMIFLGQEELGLPKLFDFRRHYYGPYSSDFSDTIEKLISRGDLLEDVDDSQGYYIKYWYALSEQAKTETLGQYEIGTKQKQMLKELARIPLSSILAYVYQKYCPKQAQGEVSSPI